MSNKTTITLQDSTRHKAYYLGQELGFSTLSALLTHLINNEFNRMEDDIRKHQSIILDVN